MTPVYPANRERATSLLCVHRLPGRINGEQTAEVLGFQPHDIPQLVKAGLLQPLGGAPKNCVKFFAAFEVEELRQDRRWLDRATKAIRRRGVTSSNTKRNTSLAEVAND